jgi:heme/copper-type cytochrome/quinol oxidase subunit 3
LQEVTALEVQSGLIFVGIVAAVLIATGGLGVSLALLLHQADHQVRITRVHADQIAAQGGVAVRPPLMAFPPSPATELLRSSGHTEAPPALGLNNTKFGMWIFLASEVMFFTALIATFTTFKLRNVISANGLLNVPLAAVNTFILLFSSFTVVLALDAIQDGKRNRFFAFMGATVVLGAVFVGIQGVEWGSLMRAHISATSNLFGTTFFVTTGFHGAHVIIGIIWLVTIMARARYRGEFTPDNNLGYELFGLYWHFVDIVWIILFTVIYLL